MENMTSSSSSLKAQGNAVQNLSTQAGIASADQPTAAVDNHLDGMGRDEHVKNPELDKYIDPTSARLQDLVVQCLPSNSSCEPTWTRVNLETRASFPTLELLRNNPDRYWHLVFSAIRLKMSRILSATESAFIIARKKRTLFQWLKYLGIHFAVSIGLLFLV